ncbi:MAG: LysM peptidoglycan-binding domain-containing protein, partial [Acetobacteraceae bacterium]
DQGKAIGTSTADQTGSWLFIPPAPLPSGPGALTLSERTTAGATVAGNASALLLVPAPAATQAPALAVLTTPNAAPRVLQAPGRTPGKLALDTLDYGQSGNEVRFAGTASTGSVVRVYVDNAPVGQATADADGAWSLSPAAPLAEGLHHVRLDQIGPHGRVVARVELPFSRQSTPISVAVGADSVVVQPGSSLWRLARQAYGSGIRYTEIYAANQEVIGNPNLIYPGQVLTVPKQ